MAPRRPPATSPQAALMASKIRSHALKKSRKAATAAAELLARAACLRGGHSPLLTGPTCVSLRGT